MWTMWLESQDVSRGIEETGRPRAKWPGWQWWMIRKHRKSWIILGSLVKVKPINCTCSLFFQVTFGVMNEMEFVLFALIKPSIGKVMIKLFQREMLSFLRGFMRKWQSWPETHCWPCRWQDVVSIGNFQTNHWAACCQPLKDMSKRTGDSPLELVLIGRQHYGPFPFQRDLFKGPSHTVVKRLPSEISWGNSKHNILCNILRNE